MAYTGKKPTDHTDVIQSQSMTVTDDLTVDTNTLKVDSTNNNVGIGTSSPNSYTGFTTLTLNNSTNGAEIDFEKNGTVQGSIFTPASADDFAITAAHASGDLILQAGGYTERMRVDSSGNVGINRTSPNGLLHMQSPSGTDSALFIQTSAASDDSVIHFGDDSASSVGSILYDHSTNSMQFETNSAERMRITSDGDLLLGVTSGTNRLTVSENQSGGYAASFHNDGNNVDRYGLLIFNGTDNNSGTNAHIQFADGDGSGVGLISSSGGTVNYGPFTAMHPCVLPDADNDDGYPYGTLLETTSLAYTQKSGADTERGLIYNVRKTQSANSKAVLGAYGSSMNDLSDETNKHQALVLGDGHILCNNSGGNISIGDGICTSAVAGIGQKATANPSMIIGIAQEAVTFADDTETKLVAVQYGLQQFIPWS